MCYTTTYNTAQRRRHFVRSLRTTGGTVRADKSPVNTAQPPLDQDRLAVAAPLEPSTEVRLVEDARRRTGSRLYGRDQLTTLASGLGFFATALTIRATADVALGPSLGLTALLIVSYAVLSRIEFELGSGTVLPTELVLVPMLFLVPAAEVPLFVALAFILGGLPDMLRGRDCTPNGYSCGSPTPGTRSGRSPSS